MLHSKIAPLLASLVFFVSAGLSAPPAAKPNILLILADDMGYADPGCFGGKAVPTPHLDRIAQSGLKFNNFYAASAVCTPTRAAILTGKYPLRFDIRGHFSDDEAHLPRGVTTLPGLLRQAGYVTGHVGKWHLGAEPYSPLEHGFDVDIPHHPGPGPAGSYVAPWKFKDFDHDPDIPDEHLEDRMAKEAVSFMERRKDKPFLLNVWASWCPTCRYEHPVITDLAKSGAIRVIGLNYRDGARVWKTSDGMNWVPTSDYSFGAYHGFYPDGSPIADEDCPLPGLPARNGQAVSSSTTYLGKSDVSGAMTLYTGGTGTSARSETRSALCAAGLSTAGGVSTRRSGRSSGIASVIRGRRSVWTTTALAPSSVCPNLQSKSQKSTPAGNAFLRSRLTYFFTSRRAASSSSSVIVP